MVSNRRLACNKPDLLAAAAFLVLACSMYWFARDLPAGQALRMGPGYFPRLVAHGLTILSLILLVRSLFETKTELNPWTVKPLLLVLIPVFLFGYVVRPLGLPLTALLLVSVCGLAAIDRRLHEVALLAVGLAAGSTVLFAFLLRQPIPIYPWFMQ